MGSGSVYSLLYRMEREGLIAGTWIERRRTYGLTDKGKAVAEATEDFLEDFVNLSVLAVSALASWILLHELAGEPPFSSGQAHSSCKESDRSLMSA